MTNIEKLVDFITERDEDGKLFDAFVALLEMSIASLKSSAEDKNTVVNPDGSR